ncbi:hypothetical protein [Enterobacter ludwigii]|uniref:hypothetical protein n=1 Tax=Enterobacter ludwigii TaxID=299767 RepID=UPI004067770F
MSTITKQWLQQKIAEMEEHRDLFPGDLDDNHGNVLAALRIALASLEAEAVAYSLIFRNMDGVLNDYVNANTTFSTIEKAQAYGRGGNYVEQNDGSLQWVSDPSLDPVVVPLYTAPPAPVSVPDAYVRDERGRMMLNGRQEPRIGYGAGWNGYRAAMLQGADGNSPVITDELIRRIAFNLVYLAADEKLRSDDDSLFALVRRGIDVVRKELAAPQQGVKP